MHCDILEDQAKTDSVLQQRLRVSPSWKSAEKNSFAKFLSTTACLLKKLNVDALRSLSYFVKPLHFIGDVWYSSRRSSEKRVVLSSFNIPILTLHSLENWTGSMCPQKAQRRIWETWGERGGEHGGGDWWGDCWVDCGWARWWQQHRGGHILGHSAGIMPQ